MTQYKITIVTTFYGNTKLDSYIITIDGDIMDAINEVDNRPEWWSHVTMWRIFSIEEVISESK